jgi:hypothetical protein
MRAQSVTGFLPAAFRKHFGVPGSRLRSRSCDDQRSAELPPLKRFGTVERDLRGKRRGPWVIPRRIADMLNPVL